MNISTLKISVISLLLFSNILSFGMSQPINPAFTAKAANYYKKHQSPTTAENILIDAQKKNKPLKTVLTPTQLSILSNKYFNELLQKASSQAVRESKQDIDTIDLLNKKRLGLFLALPGDKAEKIIHNQIERMEDHLVDNKRKTWEKMINKTFPDGTRHDEIIQRYKQPIGCYDVLKGSLSESKKQEWKNSTTWDPNLPYKWVKYLDNAFQENNVHPTSINTTLSLEEKPYTACTAAFTDITEPETITLFQQSKPYKQYESSYSKKEFNKMLKHLAYHEAYHSAQSDTRMDVEFRRAYFDSGDEMFPDNKDFRALQYSQIPRQSFFKNNHLAVERAADMVPILKKPTLAKGAMLCKDGLYPGSYTYLLTADANWQASELFKKNKESSQSNSCNIF